MLKPAVVPATVTLLPREVYFQAFSIRWFGGHEETGIIDMVGNDATERKQGQGVAVGGGFCCMC